MRNLVSIHLSNVRINIANSSGKIDVLIFNDAIRAYWKYFRKVVETWNMQNNVLTHCRKLRIDIAYSSGEIKLWNI